MSIVIKNVEENVWRTFKSESAKHGLKHGDFLARLVNEHVKHEKKLTGWDLILHDKPTLSDKEAKEMLKAMKELRKSFKMRH